MTKPLCYLNPNKANAGRVLNAFASGSGADITTNLKLQPGRVAVLYGVDKATMPLWREIERAGHPYYYIDNGYFGSKWQGGNYYRITKNAEQHHGLGESDGMRWRNLGLAMDPWRHTGEHILIACATDWWHSRHGDGSARAFADTVTAWVKANTWRKVIVRHKPLNGHIEPPLELQLRDCWAVVTHTSMVAAEAVLRGVPVFLTAPGACGSMASGPLTMIESPQYPADRLRWASVLADNQWTLDEIAKGIAWQALRAGSKSRGTTASAHSRSS